MGLDQGHGQPQLSTPPKVSFALSRSIYNGMHGHDIGHLLWPLGTHMVME